MPWTTQRAALLRWGRWSTSNFVRGARLQPCCSRQNNLGFMLPGGRGTDRCFWRAGLVAHFFLALVAEAVRAAASVPTGQQEASRSLGLDTCRRPYRGWGLPRPLAVIALRSTVGPVISPVAGHHACFHLIGHARTARRTRPVLDGQTQTSCASPPEVYLHWAGLFCVLLRALGSAAGPGTPAFDPHPSPAEPWTTPPSAQRRLRGGRA